MNARDRIAEAIRAESGMDTRGLSIGLSGPEKLADAVLAVLPDLLKDPDLQERVGEIVGKANLDTSEWVSAVLLATEEVLIGDQP